MSKKTVPAGTYVITIRDRSAIHNFHLTGPGVDKRTSLGKVYTTTWKVTLKKGTYKFVCDPHAAIMSRHSAGGRGAIVCVRRSGSQSRRRRHNGRANLSRRPA